MLTQRFFIFRAEEELYSVASHYSCRNYVKCDIVLLVARK